MNCEQWWFAERGIEWVDCLTTMCLNNYCQTTIVCSTCGIPLCKLVLSKQIQTPKDCICSHHENMLVLNSEFSIASLDNLSNSDSKGE